MSVITTRTAAPGARFDRRAPVRSASAGPIHVQQSAAPADPPPSDTARIAALEDRVAALEARVDQLEAAAPGAPPSPPPPAPAPAPADATARASGAGPINTSAIYARLRDETTARAKAAAAVNRPGR